MTSGLFWAWARSTALRIASWVLSVQRFGRWPWAYLSPRSGASACAGAAAHQGLAQRHQVAPVLAMGLLDGVARLGAHALELGA